MPAPSYHAQPDAASRVRLHVLEGTGPAHVPEGRGPPPPDAPEVGGEQGLLRCQRCCPRGLGREVAVVETLHLFFSVQVRANTCQSYTLFLKTIMKPGNKPAVILRPQRREHFQLPPR